MPDKSEVAGNGPVNTDQPGLVLIHMDSREDDQAYFELQNANKDYWQEFGNSIDDSVDKVSKRRIEHGNGRFGIWLDGKLIGMAGFSTKGHAKEAEVGVMLAMDSTGHGYATSAITALTKHISPKFDRVYADVAPDNARSINMLTRSGYVTDGKVVARDWGPALIFEAKN